MEGMEITVPHLPEGVIINILSRLRIKHLVQLKCVSKPWQSLISDPQFAKLQLAQSKKNNLSCHRFISFTDPIQTVDLEDLGDGPDQAGYFEYPAEIKKVQLGPDECGGPATRGSCNGLIWIAFSNGRNFLWNPTIREALEILPNDDEEGDFSYFYGLGYDFSTDDYKLVRASTPLFLADKCINTRIEIFASKSNEWREMEQPGFFTLQTEGIFLHGALHWMGIGASDPKEISVIFAFDMRKEKFYELGQLPDCDGMTDMCLTNSGDSLFLIYDNRVDLQVWKLNGYGDKSSWIKIFSDNIPTIPFRYDADVTQYTKTGKIVFSDGKRCFFCYDTKRSTYKMVSLLYHSKFHYSMFRYAIYAESLVLPDWYRPSSE